MKVNFVLHHADMSGGVRVVAIYARELARRGHAVTIVSTPWPTASLKDYLRSIVYRRPWPSAGGARHSHLDSIEVTHKVLDSFRPVVDSDLPDADVVVATWWKTAAWVAKLSPSKGAKTQLIQHYETWGGPEEEVKASWRLPLHHIVISKWLEAIARNEFGETDVSYVPNSVDTSQFHAPPRGKQRFPTIGMLYSQTPFKGCKTGIASIEQAAKNLPSLHIVAMGVGPLLEDMPVPAGATYYRNPPQDQIRDIYARCDAWLCSSTAEGFYLPLLESMACRCPVVSTRVGGPVDLIRDGENGYLADIGDVAGLADRLTRVLTLSDDAWRAMSDSAHATACRYTWQDACDLLEKAFAAAIDKAGKTL